MTIHASRSRYESFDRCLRRGYYNYHFKGRGIQPKGKNINLATGIWVHKFLELVGKYLMKFKRTDVPEDILGAIIAECKLGYHDYVFPPEQIKKGEVDGFELADEGWDQYLQEKKVFTSLEQQKIQQDTFNEQAAIMEALGRAFVLKTLPRWTAKYKIASVENDMSFPLVHWNAIDIIQSATIDWVLQEKETKDVYIVSFKTINQYDNRNAKANSHDTQGLSETWAFEEYLRTKGIDKKVDGVIMLFLVKGVRKQTFTDSGIWQTTNPLIRGWRRMGVDGIEYAHSWWISKPENKSGWGTLGNSWDSFDVYGSDGFDVGGVKGWLELIQEGSIQPDCSSPLDSCIIEPIPYMRSERSVDSWLRQTKAREIDIAAKLIAREMYDRKKIPFDHYLDETFQQTRASCHYPGDCSYLTMCYGTEEEKRLWMEKYEKRTPHHKAELIQLS